MKYSISELLQQCSKLSSTKDKVAFLQANDCEPLRAILFYALDPRARWALPVGAPPYKPCEFPDQHGRLYTEARKLYMFIEGGNPNLHPMKREQLFIRLLESIDPDDAKLLCSVKDKKIPYKGINKAVVNAAFPGLIQEKE
jgi:hypothetical protein